MSKLDIAARMLGSSLKETLLDHNYVEGNRAFVGFILAGSSGSLRRFPPDHSRFRWVEHSARRGPRNRHAGSRGADRELAIALNNFFLQPGHAIQIVFSHDPGESGDVLSTSPRRTRHVACNLGPDISDILDEWQNHLSKWVVREDIAFCLYSRPTVLSLEEGSRGAADLSRRSAEIPPMREAMKAAGSHSTFVTRHMGFVNSVVEALRKIGQRVEVLPPDDSIRRINASIYPSFASTIGD